MIKGIAVRDELNCGRNDKNIQNLKMYQSTSKIDYLQKQNKQLREQIQDLKQQIKFNKTEIDILANQLKGNSENQKLMEIIISYKQKEQKMQDTLNLSKKEIAQLSTDNLVLRQLNDGQNVEMKNMEALNAAAVALLNKKINELEDKLTFLEKSHKEYDKVSGFVTKSRDVVNPQEIALELKSKEYDWMDEIAVMKAEVAQSKKSEQDLIVVNTILRNKIVSLQAQLAMPNRNLGEVLDKSLKKLMLYFIEVQKKIITGDEDSDSDEENDIELIAPELSGVFPERQLRLQRDYGVPHLDLLKVRDHMSHTSLKIKEALAQRNHLSDKEKVERLEIELEFTRRELSKNIIDLRDERSLRKKTEKIVNQLEGRVDLLIRSNQYLKEKVEKYWNKLKNQREKAYGVCDNIETGKGLVDDEPLRDLDETLKPMNFNAIVEKASKSKAQPMDPFMLVNPSMLLNEYNIEYKIHLQILKKQLDNNPKISNISKMKPTKENEREQQSGQPKRMKRSTSNPLLYFNERRNNIMEVHDSNQQDERERLEQTCYQPNQHLIGFEQVLDEYDNN